MRRCGPKRAGERPPALQAARRVAADMPIVEPCTNDEDPVLERGRAADEAAAPELPATLSAEAMPREFLRPSRDSSVSTLGAPGARGAGRRSPMAARVRFGTRTRIHISLDVADLEASVAFHRVLFEREPSKTQLGCVRFEIDDPPTNLETP